VNYSVTRSRDARTIDTFAPLRAFEAELYFDSSVTCICGVFVVSEHSTALNPSSGRIKRINREFDFRIFYKCAMRFLFPCYEQFSAVIVRKLEPFGLSHAFALFLSILMEESLCCRGPYR